MGRQIGSRRNGNMKWEVDEVVDTVPDLYNCFLHMQKASFLTTRLNL